MQVSIVIAEIVDLWRIWVLLSGNHWHPDEQRTKKDQRNADATDSYWRSRTTLPTQSYHSVIITFPNYRYSIYSRNFGGNRAIELN